jgi:uncharacterized protein YbjT (DUF2867 family)
VIDVLNTAATDPDQTTSFFGRTSDNLLSAGQRCGVRHHVLLSIVNVDGVPDNAHYLGKVAQEQRVEAGLVPRIILRQPSSTASPRWWPGGRPRQVRRR